MISVLSNTETFPYVPFYVVLVLRLWSEIALEPGRYITAFVANWQGNPAFMGLEAFTIWAGASLRKRTKIHEYTIRYKSEYLSGKRNHNQVHIF